MGEKNGQKSQFLALFIHGKKGFLATFKKKWPWKANNVKQLCMLNFESKQEFALLVRYKKPPVSVLGNVHMSM